MAFECSRCGIRLVLTGGVLALAGSGTVAGHDPTAPPPNAQVQEPTGAPTAVERPSVHAILRSGDRRIAFVGDGYVREGDELAFGRVERIERHAVIFRRDGSLVHVPVQGTDIKMNRRDSS